MNPYPAVVSAFTTITDDKGLIEAVRACGGDDLAALLEERLQGEKNGDWHRTLKSILCDLNSAILSAESASDDLSNLIEKEGKIC